MLSTISDYGVSVMTWLVDTWGLEIKLDIELLETKSTGVTNGFVVFAGVGTEGTYSECTM